MRSTEQRVNAVFKEANKLQKRKQQRRLYASMVASGVFSLALVVICAYQIPEIMVNHGHIENTADFSASMFANPQLLSYIMVGIIAALLGICVTMLCVLLHKKAKQLEEDTHEH